MRVALSAKQRRLRQEIEDIASQLGLDNWNIEDYKPATRSLRLEIIKNQLVRSDVVISYTFIDECLTHDICNYYFRLRKKNRKVFDFGKLWRTKRFSIFAHYIMDETYLMKKLAIVNAIKLVPKDVRSATGRINDTRNAIAHGFFPENRRVYAAAKKVLHNDVDLFSLAGVRFEPGQGSASTAAVERQWSILRLE